MCQIGLLLTFKNGWVAATAEAAATAAVVAASLTDVGPGAFGSTAGFSSLCITVGITCFLTAWVGRSLTK